MSRAKAYHNIQNSQDKSRIGNLKNENGGKVLRVKANIWDSPLFHYLANLFKLTNFKFKWAEQKLITIYKTAKTKEKKNKDFVLNPVRSQPTGAS